MIPNELIYIAHLLSITALSPSRVPYLRLYVGSYLSIIGICSVGGAYFPATFVHVFLKFIQAFAVVDMLSSRNMTDILYHIAAIYVSRTLEGVPDLQHIPTLCIGAIAPTYYVSGSVWPAIFVGRIYALLLITCSLGGPLYIAATNAMTNYVFGIYAIMCTHAAYSLGVYVNSHP